MQLYIIRHTKVNVPKGLCYGQTDVALADTSVTEIAKVVAQIDDVIFDKIFSSPLTRCKALAKSVAKNKYGITFDAGLKELNFGDWENRYWHEIEKTEEAKAWFKDFTRVSCPNGESYLQLIDRVTRFLQKLKSTKQNANVAIICHAGVIRAFHSIINKVSPEDSFNLKVGYGELINFKI